MRFCAAQLFKADILAGDGLLNFAYETAALAFQMEPQNVRVGEAFAVLAKKAGIYGMVGGQTVDVQTDKGEEITREKLDFIYRLKTSALIEASMLVGAILAGVSKEEQDIIAQVAGEIGLAFQIQDDVLDVTSTMEVLGKPIGSDEKNNKAKQDVERISVTAVERLSSLPEKNKFLEQLLLSLIQREK